MRKLYSLIIIVVTVIGLGFFVEDDPIINPLTEARFKSKRKVPEFITLESPWIDSIINSLTLEQKIAQLIMYPVYSNKGDDELVKVEKLMSRCWG